MRTNKPKSKKKKDVLTKLKNWLIHGKSITHNNAQRMWGTNRLAEYVRRLRHDHGMKIEMKMKAYADGIYGVYKFEKKKRAIPKALENKRTASVWV